MNLLLGVNSHVQYPISIAVLDNPTDISIELTFKAGFISSSDGERVARALGATVLSLVSNPNQSIRSLASTVYQHTT